MTKTFTYEMQIQEMHLDTFGHLNHATYLQLLEQARWEVCNEFGVGIEYIKKTGIGPVVLDAKIKYSKEIKNREKIKIHTHFKKARAMFITAHHEIEKGSGKIAATANLTVAIWDIKTRKIIEPTADWLKALHL